MAESFRVPSGSDEQGRGHVGADSELVEQRGRGWCGELGDRGVQFGDLWARCRQRRDAERSVNFPATRP